MAGRHVATKTVRDTVLDVTFLFDKMPFQNRKMSKKFCSAVNNALVEKMNKWYYNLY